MKRKAWSYFAELRAVYRLRPSMSYVEFVYCVALLTHARRDGSTYVGPDTIAAETGFSRRHVEGAAAALKRRGVVKIIEQGRRGYRGVLRLSATSQCTEAHFGESGAHSPKCSARFTEVQTRNAPKPTSDSSTTTINDTINGAAAQRIKRTTTPRRPRPETDFPPSLDTPEFRAAWADFQSHRRELKHPLTSTARQRLIEKLDRWGAMQAVEALRTSVGNGWRGVFEPKSADDRRNRDRNSDFENAPGPFKPRYPTPEEARQVLREADGRRA